MTVSSTNTKKSYNGDNTTAVFAYDFKITSADQLLVLIRNDTTGVESTATGVEYDPEQHLPGFGLNTAYIVDGVDNANGGNVTFKFNTGNPSDPNYSVTDFRPKIVDSVPEVLLIKRVLSLTQTTDYTPNDPFPAEVHEEALDKLTFVSQQQQEEIDRSFKFAETDTGTASIPVASERASKYLGFDTNGDVVAVDGTTNATPISTFGATLVDDANATTARATLGLGSLATLNTVNSSQIDTNSVTASELNISGNGSSGQYVTSDGDGSFSYITPPAFAGRLINIQSFTASGTYTPNANALQSIVYVQGGGGGGGGSDSDATSESAVGAGGNGGGYIQSGLIDVSAGGYSSTITVGAGGAGGSNTVGADGADSIYNDGTISLTAKGGGGADRFENIVSPNAIVSADTAANTVSNHTPVLNIGTNPGGAGISMESSGGDNRASGGAGGGSFFGYGGRGGSSASTSVHAGTNGVGHGSGGGGAAMQNAISGGAYPGGDGAGGIIIIYEYT